MFDPPRSNQPHRGQAVSRRAVTGIRGLAHTVRQSLGHGLLLGALISPTLAGCEVDDTPQLATGVDIMLPDGASLALDGLLTRDEVRPTSPAAELSTRHAALQAEARTGQAATLQFRGGDERAPLAPGAPIGDGAGKPARRYHIAWIRLSVPQPDGSVVISEFERAPEGAAYWSEPKVHVRSAGDAAE